MLQPPEPVVTPAELRRAGTLGKCPVLGTLSVSVAGVGLDCRDCDRGWDPALLHLPPLLAGDLPLVEHLLSLTPEVRPAEHCRHFFMFAFTTNAP